MAPPLTKEMAQFHFTEDAAHIHNWVRGMNPWPVAWFAQDGKRIKVLESRLAENPQHAAPGTVLALKPLTIAAANGAVALLTVTPEGGKPMAGTAQAWGRRQKRGGPPVTPCNARRRCRLAVKGIDPSGADWLRQPGAGRRAEKCTPPLDSPRRRLCRAHFTQHSSVCRCWTIQSTALRKKPVAKLDAPVRAVLRAGLAQATAMQVPLPAAVNESVRLTRRLGKIQRRRYGQCRTAQGRCNRGTRGRFCRPSGPRWARSIYCLSRPVVKLFYNQYGEEAFAMAGVFYEKRPATTIRVNTLRTTDAELTDLLHTEGHSVRPGPWPHALLVEFNGSPAASRTFARGLFHVQGLASQFAALCVDAQPGQQVRIFAPRPEAKA